MPSMSMSLPVRATSPVAIRVPRVATAIRLAAFVLVSSAAFLASAYAAGTAPFEREPATLSDAVRAERVLPFDAPLPARGALLEAGRGPQLPHVLAWESPLSAAEAGRAVETALASSASWEMTQQTDLRGPFSTTLARVSSDNQMTHFALLSVRVEDDRTVVRFEFINTNEAREQ
jgi:hypothetical protein